MVFRNEAEFQREFERAFGPEIVDALIEALSKAYLTAQDLYDATRGSNNSTFGTGVYHHAVFELQKVAEDSENCIVTSLIANTFRMERGHFVIACHKVGEYETDNILSSFPQNYKPKHDADFNPNQLAIEFKEFEPIDEEQSVSSELVLAHMGNPEQGLCAIYLCRPRYSADNEIEWDYTRLLWTKSAATAAAPVRTYDIPQEEKSPKPQVRRKPKPPGSDKPQDETSPKPKVSRKKKETGDV